MAISKLKASLAEVTNEVTLAAAKINFDFTLVKCEAPKEYHDLSNAISSKMKEKAELGTTHITARKLGALFEGLCPATPRLIRAYGLRASEIAVAAKTAYSEPSPGIFAAHAGVDGTSIWAAATSSSVALSVQLLACMLARVWTAAEATSIWYELVEERRKSIETQFNNGDQLPFSTLTSAAQSEISRSSLAEWDSNARSWLRTADRVKAKEQKQLMLIINNINIAINKDLTVLSSVIPAWISALTVMERLLSAAPQAVNDGAALLGLSSWHIYPDILVVGQNPAEVRFGDPLAASGGALTIGLDYNGHDGVHGMRWSLSLAHLNFYGPPAKAEALFNQDNERITIPQFMQVVLGCLIGAWKVPTYQIDSIAGVFVSIIAAARRIAMEQTNNSIESFLRNPFHWLNLMEFAAQAYLHGKDDSKLIADKLVRLGLRRSSDFFQGCTAPPFFRLCERSKIPSYLKGPEARVAWLRQTISSRQTPSGELPIIQYRAKIDGQYCRQFATAIAIAGETRTRKRDRDTPTLGLSHRRWLHPRTKYSYPIEMNDFREMLEPYEQCQAPVENDWTRFHFLNPEQSTWQEYTYAYGDPKIAAVFQKADRQSKRLEVQPPSVTDLLWCLNHDLVSISKFIEKLDVKLGLSAKFDQNLYAVAAASAIYKSIPNATLLVKTLRSPFCYGQWATAVFNSRVAAKSFRLTREIALSCVAYMESGLDLNPSSLNRTMALAYEDSIYIAKQLICDPSDEPLMYELGSVLGNVGRPGLTLLVPPPSPIMREFDPSSWRLISNDKFNGRDEDHFSKTSLHLSFTNFCIPVYNEIHVQDSQAHFLESVVSVHDAGKWVGDIDILRIMEQDRLSRVDSQEDSYHRLHKPAEEGFHEQAGKLISAESWHDIFDPPREAFVVRAHGNWVARLALVAILGQSPSPRLSRSNIIICPKAVCWACLARDISVTSSESPPVYIF